VTDRPDGEAFAGGGRRRADRCAANPAGAPPAPDGLGDPAFPPGSVALVGTPIGNLGDLSPRAAAALAAADVICCEDTRRTRALLSASGIRTPSMLSIERHREAATAAVAAARAARGERVAVVTDAGMPGVSDPGERVLRAAVDAGVPVTVVPGPTASVIAVVLAGLGAKRWCFEGFLPRSGRDRSTRLAAVGADERPSVIYEAPTRVVATVADLAAVCGPERPVALARELTKLHEQVWRGTLGEASGWLAGAEIRGEWVVVVGGAPGRGDIGDDEIRARLVEHSDGGTGHKTAVAEVAKSLGVPRRRVYDLALGLREGGR